MKKPTLLRLARKAQEEKIISLFELATIRQRLSGYSGQAEIDEEDVKEILFAIRA